MNKELLELKEKTHIAWDANAASWDALMADEGNDFVNVLCWPAILRLLDPQPGERILDAACGNGIYSRRIAASGAEVTAFDFSEELIRLAKERTPDFACISYSISDATDEPALLGSLGGFGTFDSALCNMALFDIADDGPLFQALSKLLKKGGTFVFSLAHPAFNNASAVHLAEQIDENGDVRTVYSVKVSRYMTPYHALGVAFLGQLEKQVYFERPMQYHLELGFRNGFVVDGFEERAFPPDHPATNLLGWGGNFSEFPPVVVVRLRLSQA